MQTVTAEVPLYFAGKDEEINYTASTIHPVNIPVRLNIHILLWGGSVSIKRSLIPIWISPTLEYKATFNINQVLYAELFKLSQSQAFAFPGDPDQPIVERKDLMLVDFKINQSLDYIDDDGSVQTDEYYNGATTWHAIQGGMDRRMQYHFKNNDINNYLNWFNANDTQLKFLSWIPNNMPVHPSQPLRLWFYNQTKLNEVNPKVKAIFTDGTESPVQDIPGMDTTTTLLEIACGPMELRLPTIDVTKTVASYQVWLQNADGTVKTEIKSFVIDYNQYERSDVLFFRNSLGVNEVLWCHGRRKDKLKTTAEERTQPLASNALSSGTRRQYRAQIDYSWQMNTGWFPKDMRQYLADALSAGEAKLPVEFFHMPVLIDAGSFSWGEDGQDLFSVSFKIQLAYHNQYYSPVPQVASPWGDFNNDFNEYFF